MNEIKPTPDTDSTTKQPTPDTASAVAQTETDTAVAVVSKTDESAPATDGEPVATPPVSEPTPAHAAVAAPAKSSASKVYALVAVIVVVMSLVLWFLLEREGRVTTGVFDGVLSTLENRLPAATVNGETISQSELARSVSQLSESAAAQGVDVSDPAVQADIETQALETLVNTELLLQAAATAGVTTDEVAVESRYQEIAEQLGGAEVMTARMTELGLDEAMVRSDIESELIIQQLLDTVVSEAETAITEDQIQALYDNAGGAEAGLPPLEDVREQIVAQLEFEAEQSIVQSYVDELRAAASIEIK